MSAYCRSRIFLLGHVLRSGFRNEDYRRGYFVGAAYISFIWPLYAICWGLSEGSNTISPTSEMIFYGILDIFTGPVFLLSLLKHMSKFDTQALAPTAFGNAERGNYELQQQQQQPQPQPQPEPAPAKSAQTRPQNEVGDVGDDRPERRASKLRHLMCILFLIATPKKAPPIPVEA